uniref:Uncharacterized protein n=1 Tax=Electrophorus electricus TaxID=8005 RepID=A0AAY5F204_ELEEL
TANSCETKYYFLEPPKLYFSIIDDVIESIRELFLDEGVPEGVLDDLRQVILSNIASHGCFIHELFVKRKNK